MATLYVSEFARIGGSSIAQIVSGKPLASQTVAIGGESAATSNAFGAGTAIIRVHTDAVCSVMIGSAPTAVATAMRMAADQTEYFEVAPGDKIAVISNT
jgi:hypothetical protein